MAVYVDRPIWPYAGRRWCHLLADDTAELHRFAAKLGLTIHSYQGPPKTSAPHYDLTGIERSRAIALGAIPSSREEIVAIFRRVRIRDGRGTGAASRSKGLPNGETAMDDRLYSDADLVGFYDIENGWADDTRYCRELAAGVKSVLDLGCGTGLLAAALGEGRDVFGVDPAGAMLDVARTRPGGERVTWVEADARAVRLGRRFDLIVMTGHAFQVFLTDADRAAVLETIAAHLARGGRFIFDSRNPRREEWREWTPERSRRIVEHPRFGPVAAWNDVAQDVATGVVTYETFYDTAAVGGGVLAASSQIAFPPLETIANAIAAAGLSPERWMGDWRGADLGPDSPEIIPIGGWR